MEESLQKNNNTETRVINITWNNRSASVHTKTRSPILRGTEKVQFRNHTV